MSHGFTDLCISRLTKSKNDSRIHIRSNQTSMKQGKPLLLRQEWEKEPNSSADLQLRSTMISFLEGRKAKVDFDILMPINVPRII